MTPPNTTPLNEEDRLGEIKKIILESGVLDEHDKNVGGDLYSSKGNQELTADALAQYIAPNITKLIQTLEQKAELYGRLHETIEAFQAGAIDADAYSKRHATLTDEIAQLEKGSE